MVELFAVVCLARAAGRRAQAKGHGPWPYRILTACAWFAGELVGVVVAVLLVEGLELDLGVLAYGIILACGGLGVGLAFLIVSSLPDRSGVAGLGPATAPAGPAAAAQPRDDRLVMPDDRHNPYRSPGT